MQALAPTCAPVLLRSPSSSEPYQPPRRIDPHAPTPFLVLTRARSGSNFLVSLLEAHGRIRCDGEAFNHQVCSAHPPRNWTVAQRDMNRSRYLDVLLTDAYGAWSPALPSTQQPPLLFSHPGDQQPGKSSGQERTRAVGFKAFPRHLRLSEFTGLVLRHDVRKIVLRRRNFIDMYLSLLTANLSGKWMYADTSNVRHTVDPLDLLSYLSQSEMENACYDEARRLARENGGEASWLHVDYDELTGASEEQHQTLERIWSHLGVGPPKFPGLINELLRISPNANKVVVPEATKFITAPTGPLSKQNRAPRNYTIRNFEEIWASLASKPQYQAMLTS